MAKRLNFYLTDIQVKRLQTLSRNQGSRPQKSQGVQLMSIRRNKGRREGSERFNS